MDTADHEEITANMVREIVKAVNPEKIVLFGSRARGDFHEGSDIDLLIVESEPFGEKRSRRKEMARLWKILAGFPISKDLLVYSRDEVEYWRDSLNNVVAKALREGKVLYERP
ncbi:MAG: nucleotidyltransferase domain-containing protein [Desulfomonile tiedjei]|nr:nucleotidyltransferase domain-containing protein [Desulfomonile tiedjei]